MTPTARQAELLRFLTIYIGEHGQAPSFAEMATGIGVVSKHTIQDLLNRLEERGLIRRLKRRDRAIEVIALPREPADEALLASCLEATAEPFADPVVVLGTPMPRRLAKHIERALLRLRVAERRLPPSFDQPVGDGAERLCSFPPVHGSPNA